MIDQSDQSSAPAFIDRHTRSIALLILLIGLLIRLPFISIDFGRTNDVSAYEDWIEQIHSKRLIAAYEAGSPINYPPLTLYWFALAGSIDAPRVALIKLPSILADVLTALVIMWAVKRRSRRAALLAGGCYVFNPAIWYVSAYWGQTDSIYTLLLVSSVSLLARNRIHWAWLIYALALTTKLQSVAILPLLVIVTARRKTKGLLQGGVIAAAAISLLALPWSLNGRGSELITAVTRTTNAEPLLDVSAYNFWYLVRGGSVYDVSARQHPFGLPLSYRAFALGLYAGLIAMTLLLTWRTGARSIFVSAAVLCLGLFMLLTDIHERYLFPTLALLLLAAMLAERAEGLGRLFVGLSLTFLFNLITIAPFTPLLGSNLIAASIDSPLILMLKILALCAAVINLYILMVLIWRLK
jgi:Gpi18-like mannosyltransferase